MATIEFVRKAGIPAPEILFFSSNADAEDNKLGYEYICMEREVQSLAYFLFRLVLMSSAGKPFRNSVSFLVGDLGDTSSRGTRQSFGSAHRFFHQDV